MTDDVPLDALELDRRVLLALVERSLVGEPGGVEQLARESGLDQEQVRAALRRLERCGVLPEGVREALRAQ